MNSKTPVSLLQEVLMGHRNPPPQYTFNQLPGLTPEFECTVIIGDRKATARAYSKQEAKHRSAQQMLKALGFTEQFTSPVKPNNVSPVNIGNAIGKLNEFASQNRVPYPVYTECNLSGNLHNLQFCMKCEFATLQTVGTASNKKDAKQKAAFEMLALLRTVKHVSTIFPNNSNNNSSVANDCIPTAVDDLAVKLYKELSITLNEANKNRALELVPTRDCSVDDLQELDTVEKVKDALATYGVEYTVETFEKNPLVLMLKIKNTNQIIMESGDVYEEVFFDLLKRSLAIYKSKISAK